MHFDLCCLYAFIAKNIYRYETCPNISKLADVGWQGIGNVEVNNIGSASQVGFTQ